MSVVVRSVISSGAIIMCLWLLGCGGAPGDAVGADSETAPRSSQSAAAKEKAGPDTSSENGFNGPANETTGASGDTAHLVLAGGCFWCMEVAFEQLQGVSDVVSGYAGGTEVTADYHIVSAGLTKHAEAIRITYDPSQITEEQLLNVFFFAAHDPTQINRQFPDVGRQYRSAVFYDSDEQKARVRAIIAALNESGKFDKQIATTLERLSGFYDAEDYHQDYVKHHPDEPYVVHYSIPKRDKVRKTFPELIENGTAD